MGDDKPQGHKSGFLGSLKDALAAASRDDTANVQKAAAAAEPPAQQPAPPMQLPPPLPPAASAEPPRRDTPPAVSAAEAAREVRNAPPPVGGDRHFEAEPPTTRVVKSPAKAVVMPVEEPEEARTQLVRGRQPIKRGGFERDPVVGWLVITGGPGMGSFRPIYEGNNTIGRSSSQRISLDFGDDAISAEEQAYVRYDSSDRSFLFVPNLAKTNVVSVNSKRPTSAVELAAMDVIQMGRTQLVFVPFCGPEFDWAELVETKA